MHVFVVVFLQVVSCWGGGVCDVYVYVYARKNDEFDVKCVFFRMLQDIYFFSVNDTCYACFSFHSR